VRDHKCHLLSWFPVHFVAGCAACVACVLLYALVGEGEAPVTAAVHGASLQIDARLDKAFHEVGRSILGRAGAELKQVRSCPRASRHHLAAVSLLARQPRSRRRGGGAFPASGERTRWL